MVSFLKFSVDTSNPVTREDFERQLGLWCGRNFIPKSPYLVTCVILMAVSEESGVRYGRRGIAVPACLLRPMGEVFEEF